MRRRATKIVTTVIAAIAIAAGCTLGPMAGIATACIVMSLLSAFALYRSSRSRLPYRAQAATAPNPPLPASDTPCPAEEPAQEPITCQEPEEQEGQEEPEEQEEDDVEPMADGEDVEEEPDATEDAYDFSAFATDLLLSEQPIELLKKTVDQIREREEAGGSHAPCGLEQYLARRLEEAGLYSTRENEKLPVLSVARPRHSGLFYLRTSARQVTFGAQLRIVRIEAALNATLLASLHAPRAEQSSMEELYKYTQRYERSMCAQVPNVDMADWSYLAMPWQMRYGPATQGEWSVRQTIAEAIESLQTPHRLEVSFRSNVSAGDVGIEIFVTPSQAYWKSALVDGLGVVPITNEMRAKNASEYAARLAILLANHAFRTSNRIKRVRYFRGLTQRELGIRAGFDENTADVRINQYEAGLRKPKEEILTRIAEALEVNYRSLYEPTFYTAEDIMYTLFEMDEHFNIRLHEVPDENFSSRKHYAIQIRYPVAESFLQEWDLRKKELAAGIISKSEYTEWKLNWPQTADDCGKHPPKIEWRDNPSGD